MYLKKLQFDFQNYIKHLNNKSGKFIDIDSEYGKNTLFKNVLKDRKKI